MISTIKKSKLIFVNHLIWGIVNDECEIVGVFYFRLNDTVNRSNSLGVRYSSSQNVRKMFRLLPEKFDCRWHAIEESQDLNKMDLEFF